MNHYTHFSIEERENTRVFLEKGESFRSIAKLLGRSPSTICRELDRNKYANGSYAAFHAQKLANKRKLNAGIKLKVARRLFIVRLVRLVRILR